MKTRVAILGSTGSIGTQALEVIHSQKNLFEVEVLTANNNSSLLIEQTQTHESSQLAYFHQQVIHQKTHFA